MKKFIDGEYIEMTEEEISELKARTDDMDILDRLKTEIEALKSELEKLKEEYAL